MTTTKPILLSEIENVIKELNPQTISSERKAVLQPLTDFIQSKVSNQQEIRINFICTHNSRRSHLSQVWAQTMANYFNIKNVFCYSGGTEATALFPMVVETLQKSGFQISKISQNENPVYSIKYTDNEHPIIGFSKKLDDDFNPKSEFAAIMTCDSANEACPFVPGAEKRIPIMFEDPKAFDNTPLQAEKYNERSLQIATELFYVFSQINS
ncbi:MAG: Protein ArsC [Formosa sp. Hel3_A1_48]|jgi:arsenate reductase|uniref:protein-tyrosine-phosphatase n=1 Tax=Polaribacter sp. HL-MS24 TaxID=3077735 RepID=UPI0023B43B5D|nr:protein-tyrosine-phosphatase [Polaribacter sp. HL-MS24]MDC3182455.1 protein-tyrosine-phosphatase [Flavobacteriaceae bacterium]WOC40692.1 protein-tyrosine-phosphatase [Polaribacter sp. HL-MS24]CAI8154360.1 MAG: Protein ArsC [Formosa sp. Hel3_A1_48]